MDAATGQGTGDDGHAWIRVDQGDDDQAHTGDGGHASRQAVQAVDEVDGVGDEDDPEQGDRNGQNAQVPVPAQGHQAAEKVDLIAAQHRHSGSHQLHHQLFHGRQVVDVIKDPQQDDDGRPGQHTDVLGPQGRKEQSTAHEAHEDGQAAHTGGGFFMQMSGAVGTGLAGHIDGSRPERRLHGEGGGEISDEKGSQQSHCRRDGSRMNG